MNEMDFNSVPMTSQLSSNAPQAYHLTKVDVFIIRAYKIIRGNSILNSSHIQGSLNVNPMNSSHNTNSYYINSTFGVHPQYSDTFTKISSLYNIVLPSGVIGDISTSPKSAIELFHRFQQIIKELELNFELSPYNRYFNKINNNLFQIKDDSELSVDEFWNIIGNAILAVFNPRNGKINNKRHKLNKASTRNSESTTTTVENNQSTTDKMTDSEFLNLTNGILDEMALPHQLQRKIHNIPQEANSRSLSGYYTQPTSPGGGNSFPFNLENTEDLLTNNFNSIQSVNVSGVEGRNDSTTNNITGALFGHRKRRSMGSINIDAIDDATMEDILKFTNFSKKSKSNMNNMTTGNDNTAIENGNSDATTSKMNENDQILLQNNLILAGNRRSQNNKSDSSNIPLVNTGRIMDGKETTSDSHINETNNIKNSRSASNNGNVNSIHSRNNNSGSSGKVITDTIQSNSGIEIVNDPMSSATIISNNMDTVVQEVRSTYDMILIEKDKRIFQLENELKQQQEETVWLRKLLIEDMGYIRNVLKEQQK